MKKARTNPRKNLALHELQWWHSLAILYEDTLRVVLAKHPNGWTTEDAALISKCSKMLASRGIQL